MENDQPSMQGAIRLLAPPKDLAECVSVYASIFISLCALATALYSSYETREHDRLSVRPSLQFGRETEGSAKHGYGITVENVGLGPAVIRDFSVYLDGVRADPQNKWDVWKVVAEKSGVFREARYHWHVLRDAVPLKVGAPLTLFEADADSVASPADYRKFVQDRIVIRLTSCSFYGECHPMCSGDAKTCDRLLQKRPPD